MGILTPTLQQLAITQFQACQIFINIRHPTNMYLTIQDPNIEQTHFIGRYQRQKRKKYDPYSNTCNPGWI